MTLKWAFTSVKTVNSRGLWPSFFNLSTQWAFWPVNAMNSKGLGANIFACQNSELLLTSYFSQFANTVFLDI